MLSRRNFLRFAVRGAAAALAVPFLIGGVVPSRDSRGLQAAIDSVSRRGGGVMDGTLLGPLRLNVPIQARPHVMVKNLHATISGDGPLISCEIAERAGFMDCTFIRA